jgi:hypothetical protein
MSAILLLKELILHENPKDLNNKHLESYIGGRDNVSTTTYPHKKEPSSKMGLTFHQLLCYPDTLSCRRRILLWHIRLLYFSGDRLLQWSYALLGYFYLLFNSSSNQYLQVSLSHFILKMLQLCFELLVLRLEASVLPIKVFELSMDSLGLSCSKPFQVKGVDCSHQ